MTPTQERPHFVGWMAALPVLPIQLFLTAWAAAAFGILSSAALGLHGAAPFVFFGGLTFVGVFCVAYFGKKLTYRGTTYWFHDDHILFEERFFCHNKKVIKYRDVVELTLKKSILQRIAGLGTIHLGTRATRSNRPTYFFREIFSGRMAENGVDLRDIREPDEIFTKMRILVENAGHKHSQLVWDG